MNRIVNSHDISSLLKTIFKENWREDFVFDALNDRVYSYEEIFSAALCYKKKLEDIGLKKNDTVCSLMSNSLDLVILYFAALMMQLTIAPIDTNKGKDEIIEILSLVSYKAVVCDISGVGLTAEMIDVKELQRARQDYELYSNNDLGVFDNIDYNKSFLITFTSGSTGTPKGVMHSFSNLVLSAIAFRDRFNFGKGNVFYHNLPMAYMAGILNLIVLPFISSSKIVIGERFNISNITRFWDMPVKYAVNTFWFIPAILALLLGLDRGSIGIDYASNIRIVGCVGTAPLNRKVKEAFEDRYKILLYESYGLSETLFVSTNSPGSQESISGVGEVLEGIELSFGEDGEILISAPWMFLGFSNVRTDEHFENEKFFRSGDFGVLEKSGLLTITGRKKDLIIRGGINVSPKRIEDFVNSKTDAFEESVVLGIEDENLGEKTVCFFVPKKQPHSEAKINALNSELISMLGRDYRVDEFVSLDDIPKNINGKVDKFRLKELYGRVK